MPAMLTGKLVNINGDNTAEEGSIVVSLCGYGSQVPIIAGSAIIGRLTTIEIDADANGEVEAELWGNNLISPAGTYYTVTVKDSNGDIMQVNAYVLTEGQNYDLGSMVPFDPNQPPPQLPPAIVNQLLMIVFSQTPDFPGDTFLTWGIQLTDDVTNSSTSNTLAGNLYTFIISQDSTGGHLFTWPPTVFNATPVNPNGSSITIQTFVCLANNGPMLPIGPATYYNQ